MGQSGAPGCPIFSRMAARRKTETPPPVQVPELPVPLRPRRRFYMQKMPDGVGERAVRVRSARLGARDQARADFFCCGAEQGAASNQRSMESLLGELLSELHLEEESLAPELLAEAWKEAVGGALAAVSSLQSVVRGSARIAVSHPTVRYEITRLKPQIMKALNRTFGAGSVKRMVITSS